MPEPLRADPPRNAGYKKAQSIRPINAWMVRKKGLAIPDTIEAGGSKPPSGLPFLLKTSTE